MKKILIFILMIFHSPFANSEPERIFALTILGEARNQGQDGMRAVAQVILNRSKDRGIAPDAVCMQQGQFDCWNHFNVNAWRECPKASNVADALAAFVCNDIDVGKDLIGDRTHYYAHDTCFPYWAESATDQVIIGDHTFITAD